jgi:hypothetical protein
MLFGKSAPPRFDGTMWSTTYPGRLWCEFGSEPDSMGLALWMESGSGYAARAACQISGIVAVSAKLAHVKLFLLDLLCQLDATDNHPPPSGNSSVPASGASVV